MCAVGLVAAAPATAAAGRTEVVVTLDAPPLAHAVYASRALTMSARRARLDLRSPTSVSYLRREASAQRVLQRRIAAGVPGADVRWHYGIVVDGIAVDLPTSELSRLHTVPGVARVWPSFRYHALGGTSAKLNESPQIIGAPDLWGPTFQTAGNGMKIGIIDDGLFQKHEFFNPSGFSMPPGFPKGNRSYTTAKVIVARAFAPAKPHWKNATLPYDPMFSEHATHVAGIAAGDHGVVASGGLRVSGIAPNAYLGNYKVLSIPTPGVGLDGNSPEITKGIESAVADGMDVINLSLGEPEVDPAQDIVVKAIDGAAEAGVVPAIAAGNDFDSFGRGSVGSPGSAPEAITAAASSKSLVIAPFSSSGPTPITLQMKPDVTAPGVDILSSVPHGWDLFSGTSMASPHVAGAAALLKERHPSWTVEQVKSALEQTGRPVFSGFTVSAETTSIREGGGIIFLPTANDPLIFADPSGVSFKFVRPGTTSSPVSVALADAGGGAGTWSVSIDQRGGQGVTLNAPTSVTIPGPLDLTATAAADAPQADVTGFVVLSKDGQNRRIPYWLRVASPALQRDPHSTLTKTGTYKGNTSGKPANVDTYRYPDNPSGSRIAVDLPGPEQVFQVKLTRPAANFGVAVLSQGSGVSVQPRVVASDDENRLTGYPALPINLNPYLPIFFQPVNAAGAILPSAGTYDIVFDSTSRAHAGAFTFRYWINDTTPPTVRLLTRSARAGGVLKIKVTDAGSEVDPSSLLVSIDGGRLLFSFNRRTGIVNVPLIGVGRGSHRLVVQASDYQESRNMEDVGPILPNTRKLSAGFRVR